MHVKDLKKKFKNGFLPNLWIEPRQKAGLDLTRIIEIEGKATFSNFAFIIVLQIVKKDKHKQVFYYHLNSKF